MKKTVLVALVCLPMIFSLTARATTTNVTDCTSKETITLSALHRLPDAIAASSDTDWLQVLENTASHSVESGEWAARLKAHESRLRRWAVEPELPPSPRPALKTTMSVKPTGFILGTSRTNGESELTLTFNGETRVLPTVFPAGTLAGFSRLYLFIDATRPTEVDFARHLEEALASASRGTIALRIVLTGGSPRTMSGLLTSAVFADQGANLTRRLGLKTSPALVRLTTETIAVFSPRLTAEGFPDRSLPPEATGLKETLSLATAGRRPAKPVSVKKGERP